MGTTTQKLTYLKTTKNSIKYHLNQLGAEITNDDTFRSYVDKISEIKAEYPTETQVQSVQNIQPLEMHNELENNVQNIEETNIESTINVQNLEEINNEDTIDVQNEEVE